VESERSARQDGESSSPDLNVGPQPRRRGRRLWSVVKVLISIALVVGIFVFAIPKLADYSSVWKAITEMTWLELASLVALMVLNLFTYWWQLMASIPGLGLWQAAVNNQTSTSVSSTIPGGGAYLAVAVSYAMFRSWGFDNAAIAPMVAVTQIWNLFMKLGLPVIALALIALTGRATGTLVVASVIGVAVLIGALILFLLVLWKKAMARRVGSALGRVVSRIRRWLRKPPGGDWGEAAVRFRRQTIDLVVRRWSALTITTVVSHLTLYLVLLVALRHVGVSEDEVSWAQVLGVFALSRLLTAFPLTPGGLGVVELSLIGGLILAGRGHTDVPKEVFHAQVAAAVLVFRTLTFAVQIPLGGFTYLIWRANKSWLRGTAPEPANRPSVPTDRE
jgi:putative heme transporter